MSTGEKPISSKNVFTMSHHYTWNKHEAPPQPKQKLRAWWFKNKNWLWFGLVFFLLEGAYNYYYHRFEFADWLVWFLLMCLYRIAWWAYKKWEYAKVLLLSYVYPIVLTVIVLVVGCVGYDNYNTGESLANDLFNAAELITIGGDGFDEPTKPPNVLMRTARLLGGFLAAYAFLIAFGLAVGKENISRLSFFRYRTVRFLKRKKQLDYVVIIGDGIKAEDLAYDLLDSWQRFVFLDTSENEHLHKALENVRCWYFKGKAHSKQDLNTTYFWQAKAVYIINESDEANFRAVHEMDEVQTHHPDFQPQWHVHLNDPNLRESVHALLERRSAKINTFNIEQNTANNLLAQRPIDRFAETTKTAQVVIVGFNKQAVEIVLACARIGHFLAGHQLRIQVFLREEDQTAKAAFLGKNPVLDKSNYASLYLDTEERSVINYTFQNIEIDFEALPIAEAAIRHKSFSFYNFFEPENANSLYVCLDDGIQNARFLNSVLPRLSYLKQQQQRDIEVYIYYNYPDRDEQQYINQKLNALAPHIPIYCFGNMLDACTCKSIEEASNVPLAKRIAYIYHCIFGGLKDDGSTEVKSIMDANKRLGELGKKVSNGEITIDNYQAEKNDLLKYFFASYELMAKRFEIEEKPSFQKKVWLFIQNGFMMVKSKAQTKEEAFWTTLRQMDRESNLQAAQHAVVKLRQLGREVNSPNDLSMEELYILSELEHRRWNAEKLLLGWQPYLNDAEWKANKKALRDQKYHNFLVTFDNLPDYEKSKDWVQVMGVI
ncbi:MAG: hypothetical protein NXI00_02955 [Cytophagales bacterium]|nr:hypothetical protein [Cytophagales bacterium]